MTKDLRDYIKLRGSEFDLLTSRDESRANDIVHSLEFLAINYMLFPQEKYQLIKRRLKNVGVDQVCKLFTFSERYYVKELPMFGRVSYDRLMEWKSSVEEITGCSFVDGGVIPDFIYEDNSEGQIARLNRHIDILKEKNDDLKYKFYSQRDYYKSLENEMQKNKEEFEGTILGKDRYINFLKDYIQELEQLSVKLEEQRDTIIKNLGTNN